MAQVKTSNSPFWLFILVLTSLPLWAQASMSQADSGSGLAGLSGPTDAKHYAATGEFYKNVFGRVEQAPMTGARIPAVQTRTYSYSSALCPECSEEDLFIGSKSFTMGEKTTGLQDADPFFFLDGVYGLGKALAKGVASSIRPSASKIARPTASFIAKRQQGIGLAAAASSLASKSRILAAHGFNQVERRYLIENYIVCFVAGTQVVTREGLKPIERITKEDEVLSRNEKTGELSYQKVLETFVTNPDTLYHVHYQTADGEDQELITTAGHPFWVEEQQDWIYAKDLKLGHSLLQADGRTAKFLRLELERGPPAKSFTTYNFSVANTHSYFVSPNGALSLALSIWVHNVGGMCSGFRGPAAKGFDWEHIFDRHASWGRTAQQRTRAGATIFEGLNEKQIKARVKAAWKNRVRIEAQRAAQRTKYQGIDPESGQTIEFWFDDVARIVTSAYPVSP